MNKIALAIVLLVVVLMSMPAVAQEEEPAWAIRLEQQNAAILSKLDAVKLAGQQGEITWGQQKIITDKDHDGALVIRNYNYGGTGLIARGGAVGLNAEGTVGLWAIGDTGMVTEGNKWNGFQAIGTTNGISALGQGGYGLNLWGTLRATEPDLRKAGSK